MTDERKIELIAESMDLEVEDIQPTTKLAELEEWDSLACLSFVAMIEDEFGKSIKGSILKEQKTVADLMSLMVD